MPREKPSGMHGKMWIVAIILLILLLGFLFYQRILQTASTIIAPTVNVSGTVMVSGFTVSPSNITFYSGSNATVASIGRNGFYSVILRNGETYNVITFWTGAGGLLYGNCSTKELNLHSTNSKLTFNVSC